VSADTDIQVWLDAATHASPARIVPHVQSATARTVQFQWEAVREGPQGVSRISQRGTLALQAGQPATLGVLQMSRAPDDACRVDIALSEIGQPPRHYRFPCP
jgi:hypothetical protein